MCVCVFPGKEDPACAAAHKKKKVLFSLKSQLLAERKQTEKDKREQKKKKTERGFYSLHASHLETAVLLFFFVCVSELDFHVRFEAVHAPSERRKR